MIQSSFYLLAGVGGASVDELTRTVEPDLNVHISTLLSFLVKTAPYSAVGFGIEAGANGSFRTDGGDNPARLLFPAHMVISLWNQGIEVYGGGRFMLSDLTKPDSGSAFLFDAGLRLAIPGERGNFLLDVGYVFNEVFELFPLSLADRNYVVGETGFFANLGYRFTLY